MTCCTFTCVSTNCMDLSHVWLYGSVLSVLFAASKFVPRPAINSVRHVSIFCTFCLGKCAHTWLYGSFQTVINAAVLSALNAASCIGNCATGFSLSFGLQSLSLLNNGECTLFVLSHCFILKFCNHLHQLPNLGLKIIYKIKDLQLISLFNN